MIAQTPESPPIELIVRPADNASASFLRRLRNPSAKSSSDSLFAGVVSARPTFSAHSAPPSKRGGGRSPIPAHTLVVRDSLALSAVRSRLRERPEVQYVQENLVYSVNGRTGSSGTVPTGRDSSLIARNMFADSLDHLRVVRALEGWEVSTGKASVSVGVVDTGIYFEHPDLAGQFSVHPAEDLDGDGTFEESDRNGVDDDENGFVDDGVGYDFVDRPHVVEEGDYDDRDPDPSPDTTGRLAGHGTAVAGVISAAAADPQAGMVGVAPETKLVSLRAFGGDGRGQTDDIAAAIVYGASRGVDVLNLSFGRTRAAPLLEEAIEFAVDQGTVVVASAGNDGAIDDPHYPSDYPKVISVMWLAEDGEGVPNPSFSQHGIGVDLGAPGSNVFTTQYPRLRLQNEEPVRQEDLYGGSAGSSFSAPQVAGAAALLRSVDPTLSPGAIQSILTATAADIQGVSWDHTTGAGRLDVARGLLRSYPARTELLAPEHNQGFHTDEPVPVVGTALAPGFHDYAVYYAEGTRNLDAREDPWTALTDRVETRAHRDTLATWDVGTLSEGAYTLRLATTLEDGQTVEDRRRVVIDRSAPEATVKFLGAGRMEGGQWGLLADVASDDTVRSRMRIQIRGRTHVVEGEFEASRQGLTWTDRSGLGGEASVRLTLTNRSGLQTQVEQTVSVPSDRANPTFFQRVETGVPNGFLLSEATDLDGDGLPGIVLNQSRQPSGGISDSLRAFEWSPSGFVSTDTLLATFIPKDVGDTNEDGQKELLLQVGGATILLEQRGNEELPSQLLYADTTGISPELEGRSFWGARLTNLDGDEWGEIVGNWITNSTRTLWRVMERQGDTDFQQVEQLSNPTEHERVTNPSLFTEDTLRANPEAATGDFDGDGRQDLLVGDRDGNWIVYESTGNDALEVAWTHETDRFGADSRFAVGNIVGDERPEFVTYGSYTISLVGGESEPPITFYSVWTAVGDDTYERAYRLPVEGTRPADGALATADFNGDGYEEVAIVHPPSLFVLGASGQGEMEVLHQSRRRPLIQGRYVVAADFTGNGTPSLLAPTSEGTLYRFVVNRSDLPHSPPRWVSARPTGPSSTRLEWRAPGADSVVVYAGPLQGALDPATGVADSSIRIEGAAHRRYALRAWRNGTSSPLSSARHVRPHAPATVTEVRYPDPTTVRLRFTEPLAPSLRTEQFELDTNGPPRSVLRANDGTGLLLKFPKAVAGQQDQLTWSGVVDTSGLAVGQNQVSVTFPAASRASLFIEKFVIVDQQRVRLTFSEPLEGNAARDPSNYSVQPYGRIEEVRADGSSPTTVTVHLDGIVAGASGREASLQVSSLQSARGNALVEEGATVRLTEPADDLRNVYVYPNPVKLSRHEGQLTIAGLPTTATIRIYSPAGRLVEVLSVDGNRTGGTTWNLRDRRGEPVPSGIYLVRVNAPDASAVLKKAAVIR